MKKHNNIKQLQICSPLEIQHFILDIPILKNEYQLNSVKFALRSIYPGNENLNYYDYCNISNKVIAIVGPKERIDSISKAKILSPVLIACNNAKNAIICSISKEWVEILVIKNTIPIKLNTFSSLTADSFIPTLDNILHDNNFKSLPLYVYKYDEPLNNKIMSYISKNNYTELNIDLLLTKKIISKSQIFKIKKSNSLNLKILKFTAYFIFVSSLIFFLFKYNFLKKCEEEKIIRKNEYQKILKVYNEQDIKNISTKSSTSIYYILSEIGNTSDNIKIISFEYDKNNLIVEIDNANALFVLDKLLHSDLFVNVEIVQSIPQLSEFERFILKGTIKNDE